MKKFSYLVSNIIFFVKNFLYISDLKININNIKKIYRLKITTPSKKKTIKKKFFIFGRVEFNQILFQIPSIYAARLNGFSVTIILPEICLWQLILYKKIGANNFVFFENIFFRIINKKTIPILKRLSKENFKYKDINLKKIIFSTLLRKEKKGLIDLNNYKSEILKKIISKSIHIINNLDFLILSRKPNYFVFEDRGYVPEGLFFEYAVNNKIDVIEFHAGHKPNLLNYKRYNNQNMIIHPFSINKKNFNQVKSQFSYMTLKKKVSKEFIDCYKKELWFSEVGTSRAKKEISKKKFVKSLNLDPKKKIACFFNHILWDATFFWGKDLFESYQDWLLQSVKIMHKKKDINWIIKCHPANVVKNFRDNSKVFSEEQLLESHFKNLPNNIKIIPSDSPISTISILKFIDYCITVRGTIGIEAACLGIPVITAGTGRYENFGFTHNSNSKNIYLNKLKEIDKLPKLNQSKLNALAFAYVSFFMKQIQTDVIDFKFLKNKSADLKVTLKHDFKGQDIQLIADWLESNNEDLLN